MADEGEQGIFWISAGTVRTLTSSPSTSAFSAAFAIASPPTVASPSPPHSPSFVDFLVNIIRISATPAALTAASGVLRPASSPPLSSFRISSSLS